MRKTFLIIFFASCFSLLGHSIELSRMEPAFWWTGMKNPELQILVQGKNIAHTQVQLDYPGVLVKEIVKPENPNYLFIYLEITKEAQPGKMDFTFTEGKKTLHQSYELRARSQATGAQGFDASDVLYLIMPDRFANGDPSNDNWEAVKVDRNEAFARHGGDLAGIDQHLDYIHDLGVTAIWLNPVLENKMPGGSYHGYAITDFYQVDQRFGSNDDYCRLIENIHSKGMKVVMDMIFNHCGSGHWWMNDFPCSDWLNHQEGFVPTSHNLYTVVDPHAPQSEIDKLTKGWFVPEMPDMNQQNPLLSDYLIQNSIWWIEYARIDGIRHDTHPYVDFDFLAKWCKAVQDEYPAFNMVGESWYLNSAPLAWWQRDAKINNQQSNLKTVMDFNLMNACEKMDLRKIYETLAQDFLYPDLNHILIFLDNHDLSRYVKKEETNLNRYKQALAFLLTTRGIPQIYYGTEILMTGEKSDGDGGLRNDFPGGWANDPINAFSKAGRTDRQNEAWDFMQKLLQWRKSNPAIAEGKLIHYAPDPSGCYVYARINGDARVLVILNGSNEEQSLSLDNYKEVLGDANSGKEIISGKTLKIEKEITVPSQGSLIIELYQ